MCHFPVFQSSVAALQAHVKQIYLESSSSVENTIQDVSRRARSPLGIRCVGGVSSALLEKTCCRIRRRSRPRTREGASEASDDSLDSYSSLFSSLTEERDKTEAGVPQPAQYLSPGGGDEKKEARGEVRSQVFRHHTKLSDDTGYYSYSAPPLSISARGLRRTSTLPIDYKSKVATLPYLARESDLTSPLGESSL